VPTDDTTSYSSWTFVPLEESIEYGVRDTNNPCNHTKVSRKINLGVRASGYGWQLSYPNNRIKVTIDGEESIAIRYGIKCLSTGWFSAPPTYVIPSWESESGRALQAMWPGVESEISALNFLWELRELKDLPHQIQRLMGLISNAAGYSRNGKRRYSETLKQLLHRGKAGLKGISDAILLNDFGIAPLVSDIERLLNILRRSEENARILLESVNKPLKRHYRVWLSQPADQSLSYSYNLEGSLCPSKYHRETICKDSWYTATMDYEYGLDPATMQALARLVLLDTLGLNFNPRVIWDGMPWSFAVDWIFKVGDFVDQFKARNVEPIVHIKGFVHSFKRTTETYLFSELGWNRESITGKTLLGIERESVYYRKPHVPNFYSALQLSGLSSREIVLASALTGSRAKVKWT
jgi:hypothetical protein